MTVWDNVNDLVERIDDVLPRAAIGLDLAETKSLGVDAIDTGRLLRDWNLDAGDHRQARLCADLVGLGEQLLQIAADSNRVRMATRLRGEVRRSSGNGHIRFATSRATRSTMAGRR